MYIDYGWGIQLWYTEKYGNFISRVFFGGGGGVEGGRGVGIYMILVSKVSTEQLL